MLAQSSILIMVEGILGLVDYNDVIALVNMNIIVLPIAMTNKNSSEILLKKH
jgi:hypothetical protein